MDELPGFDAVEGSKPDDRLPESEPAPRLKPINRKQLLLRPVDVERLVPDDHEVRAIWEFTGHLDLTLYYQTIHAVEGKAGCTAFDPRLLLSIWIYAYSKGVGSAREISRLCDYDPAYQWLTGMEPVNYHTLSDFRVAHKDSLDRLFVEVLGIMSAEGLITLERIMQDGTKVKALAGKDSFRREDRIREHLKAAEEQVRQSPDDSEASCKEEASVRKQKAQERAVKEKKERMELALLELKKIRTTKSGEEKKEARVSMTDPEARSMKQSDGGYAPAYNVQISTDAAAGVIIGVGVSQRPEDFKELVPALGRIEENTGKKPTQVVADGGFTSRENILAMEARGVDFIGSPDGSNPSAGQWKKRGVDLPSGRNTFPMTRKTIRTPAPRERPCGRRGRKRRLGRPSTSIGPPPRIAPRVPTRRSAAPRRKDVPLSGPLMIPWSPPSWKR